MRNNFCDHFICDQLYNLKGVHDELLPVLRQNHGLSRKTGLETWIEQTLQELRGKLSNLLPLRPSEQAFIYKVREERIIDPKLITDDKILGEKIQTHPLILWAAAKKKA